MTHDERSGPAFDGGSGGRPEGDGSPVVRLERWRGPWSPDDPDANFKADVAAYTELDPLATLENLGRNLDIPVGALVRYVLARWAASGSEGLLELGPSAVDRMSAVIRDAEEDGSDDARLAAYQVLRQLVSWLRVPLAHPETNPDGGAEPRVS